MFIRVSHDAEGWVYSDLQGWQLDKLAADPKKQEEESDSSDEEDIPWACYICRKPYTDPVSSTRAVHPRDE